MSKYSAKTKCPGCEHDQVVKFVKPKPLTASITKWKCELCESQIMSRVLLGGGKTVRFDSKIINESAALKEIKAETELQQAQKEEELDKDLDAISVDEATEVPNATLVTKDNLEELEKICQGSIRGTQLPAEERSIEFYNKLHDDYYEVSVGEYLCLGSDERDWYPCKKSVFEKRYVIEQQDLKVSEAEFTKFLRTNQDELMKSQSLASKLLIAFEAGYRQGTRDNEFNRIIEQIRLDIQTCSEFPPIVKKAMLGDLSD